MRTALYPGSFDPVHNGHMEIVEGACRLFDRVVMAAFDGGLKGTPMFPLAEREEMLREATAHLETVSITSFSSLVVDAAKDVDASVLIRGLRVVSDFESELQMAQMNQHLAGMDTVFIPTGSDTSFLASRLIREVSRYGGSVNGLVPEPVARRLAERFEGEAG